jgi:hypothetical protein
MITARNLTLAVAAALLLWMPLPSHAGSGPVVLLVVNMTPDEVSGGDSSKSVKWFREALNTSSRPVSGELELEMKKFGETKLRKAVGVHKGGAHFMNWKAEQFKKLLNQRQDGWSLDAAILIDSRPSEKKIDILVVPRSGGIVRMRSRSVDIDRKLVAQLADVTFLHSDRGWSP